MPRREPSSRRCRGLAAAAALAALVTLATLDVASAQTTTPTTELTGHGTRLGSGRTFQLRNGEALLALVVLALVGMLGASLLDRTPPLDARTGRRRKGPRGTRKWTHVDVSVVRLALDAPRPPGLRGSIAPGVVADLDAGELRVLALELRNARARWSHVGGASHTPMSAAMAEGLFELASSGAVTALAEGARAGGSDAPSARYRAAATAFETAVVLVVASQEEIRDFDATSDVDVAATLLALERTPNAALVQAAVVWARLPARADVLGAHALGLTAIAPRR